MNSYILNKVKNKNGLLYTKMKIFHFKDKIDSLPREQAAIMPPIHIRIKPTNVCNHNCSYCAYRVSGLQLGKDMITRDTIPKEKMFEIIDDLKEMRVKAVTFSGGGEPFCYPHLLGAVSRLIKSKISFASLTNGSLLFGEIAELFARYATWIRISLDGWDDKSYSRYRRVREGEFSKVIHNIRRFKKIGGSCYLGVSIVVNKQNAPHIYDLVMLLRDSGADSVKISPCIISNNEKNNNVYHNAIFKTVKGQIAKAFSRGAKKEFEIFDSYHTQLESFAKPYQWCPYLQILPVIGADLNVYPCQDKAYNLDDGLVGTIKKERFKDFWFSGKNKFYKINPARVCHHHCVANEKNKMILEYLNTDGRHSFFV